MVRFAPQSPINEDESRNANTAKNGVWELVVLGRLAILGSEMANIITDLFPVRLLARGIFNALQEDRAAQVTLATSLGATRFRFGYQRKPISAVRGRCTFSGVTHLGGYSGGGVQ